MESNGEVHSNRSLIGMLRRFAISPVNAILPVNRSTSVRTLWAATLAVALTALPGLWGGCAQAQNRVALVIGNGNYQNAPPLPTTLNDAADIAQSFEGLGFATTKLFNASYEDFRRAIRRFNESTQNANVAVIYFGGHGLAVGGENWLLPVDAELLTDLDVAEEAIALNSLMQSVGRAAVLGVVILDASRNNPFAVRMQRTAQSRSVDRGLARVEPSRNVLVAYAAKDGTTNEDRGGRNSPYAAALLRHLESPGLDINFIFRKVRDDVLSHTNRRQQPFVYGSLPNNPIYLKEPSISMHSAELKSEVVPADEAVWQTIKDATDKNLIADFLNKFPSSPHAKQAEARLRSLDATLVASSPQTNPSTNPVSNDAVNVIAECDRLAASPLDSGRPKNTAGVALSKIPVVAAGQACEEAMRRSPQVARFPFQAARVAIARGDHAAARELYEKASALGSSLAMYSLGLLYSEGKIVPLDHAEARRWYAKAVALKSAFAMAELAALCEKGLGGPKDAAEAFRLYRGAATAGDQVSMAKVGEFYEAGLGVGQDYAQAINWYKKSADRGDADAMRQLGRLFESGRGVPKNTAQARQWYAKAAKRDAAP
jgi:tetratricopeptide (TPR) repeat protein